MGKRNIVKKSEYKIGDIVFARDVDIIGMLGEYEIMSGPRHGLFGIYYKTRYNRKDYIHGLPDRHTGRIYKRKIEGAIVDEQTDKKKLEKEIKLLEYAIKELMAQCDIKYFRFRDKEFYKQEFTLNLSSKKK